MIENISVRNQLSKSQVTGSFDKEDLRKLFHILQERLNAAADLEITNFKQSNQTDEQYQKNKDRLREGYKLRPTLIGENGQQLYGLADEILSSPNFPDEVQSVYLNTAIYLKVSDNYVTRNSIEIFLDFTRPEILDFTLMPSGRTPNGTNFNVQGADATWVNGVFHELESFIEHRKAKAPWLHRHTIYDLLVWLFGFPIAFWACFRISPWLPAPASGKSFIEAALYVYLFLLVLVGFRTLFHYSRWVFPIVEYRHPRSQIIKHRLMLASISGGIIIAIVYDILKWLCLNK